MPARLKKPLIFLHVFKAGGTSIRAVVRDQYAGATIQRFEGGLDELRAWQALPQDERDQADVLLGHQFFGNHAYLSTPATYMSVLRHPVDRVLSFFYYVLRKPEHYVHRTGFHADMSLADFIRQGRNIELDNMQTRLFNEQPREHHPPFGGIDDAMGRAALANLARVDRVGIVEQMADFERLLREAEGWSLSAIPEKNRTPERPRADDQDAETIDLILRHNQHDLALWEAARARLAADLVAEGMQPAAV
ncbi:MAG: sulfotransferase family 2 domain-containing protein [Planctomycetota bacterium]